MKKLVLSTALAGALLAGSMTGCDTLVPRDGQYGVDPNAVTDAPAALRLPAAQVGTAFFFEDQAARIAGVYAGYFTGSDRQFIGLNEYNSSSADFDDVWGVAYANAITQLRLTGAAARTLGANGNTILGITRVLDGLTGGTVTALWGDVPYTEVGNGTPPKYEGQVAVYKAVQDTLAAGIRALQTGGGNTLYQGTARDIMSYEGNRTQWIRAAYTAKARYYMHTKEYALALAATAMGIQDSADDLMMPHGGDYLQNFNPFYSFTVYDRYAYLTAANAYAAKLLDPTQGNVMYGNAERFKAFYLPSSMGTPAAYDLSIGDLTERASDYVETTIFDATSSFPLLTAEETWLIRAEAQFRTGDVAGALVSLNTAREIIGDKVGATLTPFTTVTLKDIATEKYLALIGQIEGFNDVRRTDNLAGVPANRGTKIPERFLYSQAEIGSNPNIPATRPDLFTPTTVNQ